MQDDLSKIIVKQFELPESEFVGENSKIAAAKYKADQQHYLDEMAKSCTISETTPIDRVPSLRKCQAELYYSGEAYKRLNERYKADCKEVTIGGVLTEVFTPTEDSYSSDRVLINLHGGGFTGGSRNTGHRESIPIAVLGKIKVISIDYRMAPEHQFPAASDDVLVVYKELLKIYSADKIGIYGSSAGGLLTAQSIARFLKEDLPLPSAVGLFFGAAYHWGAGDSGHFAKGIFDFPEIDPKQEHYFKDTDHNDPLVFPGHSPALIKQFPPTLLITSVRDFALSSVVQTHRLLRQEGVEADLHVWDGLDHVFTYNSELPESQEACELIIEFFSRQMG